MREIVFRGKRTAWPHGWVYGSLILDDEGFCCILDNSDEVKNTYDYPYLDPCGVIDGNVDAVESETVGQFTGLFDRNMAGIFEGDIIKTSNGNFKVVYKRGSFWLYDPMSDYHLDFLPSYKAEAIEIVGNIYDDPKLLKEQ